MATLVSTLISRASTLAQDTAKVRWTDAEWLDWLNEALVELPTYKADAYIKQTPVALVTGVLQSLPADAIELVDVTRNTASGTTVRPAMRRAIETVMPDWAHPKHARRDIKHFMGHEADPKRWWNYPPSDGTGQVDVTYKAVPPTVTLGGTIPLGDEYASPLLNLMMYRAFSKDAEVAGMAEIAAGYLQIAVQQLTGKSAAKGTE